MRKFCYTFYSTIGGVVLALSILDLLSGGEVALQFPLLIGFGWPVSGIILFVVFVVPTVIVALLSFSHRPADWLLRCWTFINFGFWMLLIDSLFLFEWGFERTTVLALSFVYACLGLLLPLLNWFVTRAR